MLDAAIELNDDFLVGFLCGAFGVTCVVIIVRCIRSIQQSRHVEIPEHDPGAANRAQHTSRFSLRGRGVIQLAAQEAARFNHEYVGTEHILLGLINEGTGIAATVLEEMNVDLRKIRFEVEKIIGHGPDRVTMEPLPRTPRTKKVIEYSMDEADKLNAQEVDTEHLLLGLLREPEGVAAQVLMNLGLRLDDVRERVVKLSAGERAE